MVQKLLKSCTLRPAPRARKQPSSISPATAKFFSTYNVDVKICARLTPSFGTASIFLDKIHDKSPKCSSFWIDHILLSPYLHLSLLTPHRCTTTSPDNVSILALLLFSLSTATDSKIYICCICRRQEKVRGPLSLEQGEKISVAKLNSKRSP